MMIKNIVNLTRKSDKKLLELFLNQFTKEADLKSLQQYATSLSLLDSESQNSAIFAEVVDRFKKLRLKSLMKYTSNQLMGEHLINSLACFNREVLVVVFLDVKNYIISEKVVFKGTLTHSVVHPREVFQLAILNRSAKIILAHNHPSEDLEPSSSDIKFSKQMVAAGKIMGIECLDHFIVSKSRFISLKSYDFI
ncbi:JAB domain-containing protein [Holzapfeliella floricola]|nr:JAB domain-containing protein [Holzapfeliella floricola]